VPNPKTGNRLGLDYRPGAALVFDHFHFIKMANEKIGELQRALWREASVLQRNAVAWEPRTCSMTGASR
jgi:hypothetical protein